LALIVYALSSLGSIITLKFFEPGSNFICS